MGNKITTFLKKHTPFIRDAVERIISTYVQSFLGLLITGGITDLSVSTIQAAALAAIPAALSAVKALLARWKGDPDSASLNRDDEA